MQEQNKASTSRRYTREQKDQAVRLVRKLRAETGERHGAVRRVADQLGYGVESVRSWVNQADIDEGERAGTTSENAAGIKKLERETARDRGPQTSHFHHVRQLGVHQKARPGRSFRCLRRPWG